MPESQPRSSSQPAARDTKTSSSAGLDKQPFDVASMFDKVAPRYDLLNDILALGQTRGWRHATVEALGALPGQRVLDLAAGTGTSSEPYADAGIDVVAADFSAGMIAEGRRRRPDITFVEANAMDLPFEDESFDAVTISFGLRNIQKVEVALVQMLRVLKPGGKLVVCEFSQPTQPMLRTAYVEYLMKALPAVAKAIASNPDAYVYLAESIRQWPDQDALAHLIEDAGFQDVKYRNLTGGIVALHQGTKAHPPRPASENSRPAGRRALRP